MWCLLWLVLVALAGWVAGYIVGGKGFGVVGDILLGLTGGFAVRFCLEALGIRVPYVKLLTMSIWGAAGLSGFIRLLVRRHYNLKPRDSVPVPPNQRVTEGRLMPQPGSQADSHDSRAA